MQEEMVKNVLNYLYTVIVYMLAVSLILTAGSRIRRFLDAFDDLNELDLGEKASNYLFSAINENGIRDMATRKNGVKKGNKAKNVDE